MPTSPVSPLTNKNWLSSGKNSVLFVAIHAQPGAKRTAIVGVHGDKLKVCLASPPVDGKANAMLIKFFSKTLGLPKSSIQLVGGETSREKRLSISGVDAETLLSSIGKLFA